MKILFVRPKPSRETIGLQHVMIVEPLELEVLASLVRTKDVPVIIDMILERKSIEYFLKGENPDIVCVTGYITNVPEMIGYCKEAKSINPDIVTIVGGVHCEVCPDDLDSEYIDFRVVRNATTIFPKLLEYIKGDGGLPAGVLQPNEAVSQSMLPQFDFYFPFPDRSLTARYRKHYFYIFHDKVALIKTSFGCPYSCNFCFCRSITKGAYHERPLQEVIKELTSINEKNIYIVDDDFLTSRKRVEDFIEVNRSLKLEKQYLIYGRADFIAENPDLIKSFASVGLKTVIVGFESFFDHELKQYDKNIDAKTNEEAMRVLNRYNIDCYATIIVSPEWGKDEFAYCKEKLMSLGIHYVNLQPFTPLPGTGSKAEDSELIIPYSDFAKWDLAHVTIRPAKMGVDDFYRSILNLYNSILFQPKVLLRYLLKSNISMLWKMLIGSIKVSRQYRQKIKEAKSYA